MFNDIALLNESKIVKKLDIIKWIHDKDIQIFQAKVFLFDDSSLYIYKKAAKNDNKYAYHWQTKTGKLITRWDNAPHYPKLETQPHHKHLGTKNKIESFFETDLKPVLDIIAKKIV